MFYNLTMHKQSIPDVEETPRLKPAKNVEDAQELKSIVREAVKGIPHGASVVVGGLGQFQSLIEQLAPKMGWSLFVVIMAPGPDGRPRPDHVAPMPYWSREEIYEIENA